MTKVFSALLGLLLILCISGNLVIAEQNRTSGIFLHTSHFLLEKTAVNPAPRLDFPVYFSKNASDLFKPIFDKEKEQERLREAQLIGEIGTQVSDIVRAEGEIAGLKAKQDPEALAKAKEALQKEGRPATDEAVAQRAYDDAMKQYGTGSDLQRAIQAATAAAQGLAGGDVGKIVAGAGSPYVAEIIGKMTDGDSAANAMAHAALGAAVAYLNDNSALAGAVGAVAAEKLAPLIIETLFPGKDISQLTEQEKQAVVALSTLAAGIAGGLVGDSTSDAVAGGQAGQNAVENNYLSDKQRTERDKEFDACKGSVTCQLKVGAKWDAVDIGQGTAYGAGMLVGVPQGLHDAVEGIANALADPAQLLSAIKELVNSDDIFGTVSDAVKQSYIDRIDKMEADYQKAGASGAYNAGVEAGKLFSEAVAVLAGGAGVAKTGVALAEKITAKVISKGGGKLPTTPGASKPPVNAGKDAFTIEKLGQFERGKLAESGTLIDPAAKAGDLTVSGRALQKHGSREGSAFPPAKGNPSQINQQGQAILNEIVNAPGAKASQGNRFGGFDIIAPNGRGARFDAQGNFRGFLEP